MTHNVLQLGEVAEIEAQKFSFAQKFNRRTELEFSTKPAILPNCCYAFALFTVIICLFIVVLLCVGLLALLQFFVWLCAFGKTANVLPNALAILRF